MNETLYFYLSLVSIRYIISSKYMNCLLYLFLLFLLYYKYLYELVYLLNFYLQKRKGEYLIAPPLNDWTYPFLENKMIFTGFFLTRPSLLSVYFLDNKAHSQVTEVAVNTVIGLGRDVLPTSLTAPTFHPISTMSHPWVTKRILSLVIKTLQFFLCLSQFGE